jgi:hypothetical protein
VTMTVTFAVDVGAPEKADIHIKWITKYDDERVYDDDGDIYMYAYVCLREFGY